MAAIWMLGIGNWSKIRQYVPGRTSVQCDERQVEISCIIVNMFLIF